MAERKNLEHAFLQSRDQTGKLECALNQIFGCDNVRYGLLDVHEYILAQHNSPTPDNSLWKIQKQLLIVYDRS